MDVLEAIGTRQSVREFLVEDVQESLINDILEAGRWAPSGLNNQPWKFAVVKDRGLREKLAKCTKYGKTVMAAPVSIAVFLDSKEGYNRTKDVQAVGACIQNMLLATHALGLGAVWLGEIINQREEAEKVLNAPEGCELMAVIAIGKPVEKKRTSMRKRIGDITLG